MLDFERKIAAENDIVFATRAGSSFAESTDYHESGNRSPSHVFSELLAPQNLE